MNPLFFTIFKIFLILTMIFVVVKSIFVTKEASKDGTAEKITMFSGIGLINIFLLLVLFIPLIYVSTKGQKLFTFDNIYLLFFLIFILYQIYVNTRILIYKNGILVMGQYIKYKDIKKARIDDCKIGKTVMLLTTTGGMSFKIGKKDDDKLREVIKNHKIQLVKFD